MIQRYLDIIVIKTKKKSFHKIAAGDEKWLYYDNLVNVKHWLDPDQPPLYMGKREIHVKKVMLCVWSAKGYFVKWQR